MRYEYGVLFGPAEEEIEEEDEEDDDVEDADDEDGTRSGRKRSPVEIASDQPLLGMRIAMYDTQEGFEPHVAYAVMSDWAIGTKAATAPQRIALAGYMLRRIPRVLGASVNAAKGARVVTRAAAKRVIGPKKGEDRRVGCRLPMGVETMPLYALDGSEELKRLVERMKSAWASASNA